MDREGAWIIVTAGTVIDPVSLKWLDQIAEKRLANVTAKEAWEATFFETAPFKAPQIL